MFKFLKSLFSKNRLLKSVDDYLEESHKEVGKMLKRDFPKSRFVQEYEKYLGLR